MPEIYGAEHLLTARSRNEEVADKLIERIKWWEWYTDVFGESISNNPSVGNKEGGLTTITEKSLGAIAKGGSTVLEAVYEYAQPITQKGFVIMDTPVFFVWTAAKPGSFGPPKRRTPHIAAIKTRSRKGFFFLGMRMFRGLVA